MGGEEPSNHVSHSEDGSSAASTTYGPGSGGSQRAGIGHHRDTAL